jgi:hypothetical protein
VSNLGAQDAEPGIQDGTPMHHRMRVATVIGLMLAATVAQSQPSQVTRSGPPPTTSDAVGPWDAGIVKRAAELVASPATWNRADNGECPATAQTFSISCALERAVEEAAGIFRGQARAVPSAAQPGQPADCRFRPAGGGWEGTCGTLFDEVPIITLARAQAITTGAWRTDAQPSEAWAGSMADAGWPVMYEAIEVVAIVTTKQYAARLIGYNNDSATTFADVQQFFRTLEDRVRVHGGSDLARASNAVEIEIYAGGAGVIRMYNGWHAVSAFAVKGSTLRFTFDTARQIPPNGVDREILQRASTIIASDATWNRADNRKCATTATTWSIYCAVERATRDVSGGFHHRRPAMELVRQIVEDRSKGKAYAHRLMDYNNDPATTLDDVRTLFAEALARVK